MFGGPIAGSYPKQVWPKNNMRIHGAVPVRFPPLENIITINVRRSKRENLGGWSGRQKKKNCVKRRKKRRKNKHLKTKTP